MAIPVLSNMDLGGRQLLNHRVELLSADPTGGDLYEGRIWFNTTDNVIKFYDGASVQVFTPDTIENPLVNPTFNLWLDGTSFTSWAGGYTAEGWTYDKVGDGFHDITRSTDVPVASALSPLVKYSMKLDVVTADTSIAASDLYVIGQKIEGNNIQPFLERDFCLPFWVKSSKTGIHCVSFRNNGFDRSYVAEYTINAANTWEYKVVKVPASPSAGTWNYTNVVGLRIYFALMAGTTFQGPAGSWVTGNFLCSANQVNEMDSTANDFYLAMVGPPTLGNIPRKHSPRMVQDESRFAERYFQRTFPEGTVPAQNAGSAGVLVYRAYAAGAIAGTYHWRYTTRMRTTPTVTTYNPSNTNTKWRNNSILADSGDSSITESGEAGCNVTNTQVAGDGVGNRMAIHATANARL
jgi:hypothetical protein